MYNSMQTPQYDVKNACNDGRQRIAMNGEVPSVPITTLAGISSLSDLLPEMPLPSPLSSTTSNKSLLFHPRVVQEANNLLNLRDDHLIPLLAHSLLQTSSEHIELKDTYAGSEQLVEHQQQPELLRAILQRNPNVFRGSYEQLQKCSWSQQKQMYYLQQQAQNQSTQVLLQHQSPQQLQQQSPQQLQQQSPQQLQQQSPQQLQQQSQVLLQQQSCHPLHKQISAQQQPSRQQVVQQIMQQHQQQQIQQSHLLQQSSQSAQQSVQHSQQQLSSVPCQNVMQQHNQIIQSQPQVIQHSQQQQSTAFQQSSVIQKQSSAQQCVIKKSQPSQLSAIQNTQQQPVVQQPVIQKSISLSKSPQHQQQNSQLLQHQQLQQQQQQQQQSIIQQRNQEQIIQQRNQEQIIQQRNQEQIIQQRNQEQIIQQRNQEQIIQQRNQEHIIQQQIHQMSLQQQSSQQQNSMIIPVGGSSSNSMNSMSGNFTIPSTVINTAYATPVEYLSIPYSTSNIHTGSVPLRVIESPNIAPENISNMVSSRYIDNSLSMENSPYPQDYSSSASENITHIIQHPGMAAAAGNSRGGEQQIPFNSYEIASTSGNSYVYPALIQHAQVPMSQSSLLTSIPTPTPTPSPTSIPSPTRYVQRSSVITSDSMQQNSLYSLPIVEKYLVSGNLDLNMVESPIIVSDMNSSIIMHPSDIEQFNSQNDMIKIPMMENQSHLQMDQQIHMSNQHLNASIDVSCNMQLASQDDLSCYPEDILESDMAASIGATTDSMLMDDAQSNVSLLPSDLSMMTPPMSGSVQHIDSISSVQGLENNYDLPDNVTPLLDEKEQEMLFDKLRDTKMEPVIRLPRLVMESGIKQENNEQDQHITGIPNGPCISEKKVRKNSVIVSKFDSDDDEPKNKPTRYFRNREKEREIQRQKCKTERIKMEPDDNVESQQYEISLMDRIKMKKKFSKIPDIRERDEDYNKPKLKRIERKLVPVLEKLSVEELMETNTYQKFNRSIDRIFETSDDCDVSFEIDYELEEDIAPETLIPKYQLLELCSEAAKLKALACMESVPTDRIIRLLSLLEKNIRYGSKVSPIADPNDDECERKLWMELAMERVMCAVDASLIVLYILTSPNMQKKVYLEDVIDKVILFTKFQLYNTVYPTFDSTYRVVQKKNTINSNARKKRVNQKEMKEKCLLTLYTKLVEIVSMLSELINIQTLTDNTVLHLSTMGVAPFFVQNVNELQLSSMKLITSVFTKYDKHRKLLLDDILASMARLPSSKTSLRTYKLSSSDSIQMLTALILQLIQCIVILPQNLISKHREYDLDYFVTNKFKLAQVTASNFLHVFLMKCSSKSEDADFRQLFENFVQDLLTTVNKPEWPVAELMLSVLGKLLVANFVNKSLEISLRVASLDYLGVVAARLRKDTVTSNLKLSTIDMIIKDIRSEELKDDDGTLMGDVPEITDDDERIQFLQRVLLDYLAVRSQDDPSMAHARHFYICQWYQDILQEVNSINDKSKDTQRKKKNRKRKWKDSDEDSVSSENEDQLKAFNNSDPLNQKMEQLKKFFLSKINPNQFNTQKSFHTDVQHTYIDYESAELVTRYLASKRPFSKSFETFLKHIIKVLMESSVLIRTKAMKCLTMIVEVDPGILALKEMQMGVHHSFLDHSTSVREAAVDLVGKFILNQTGIIDKYYDMLSERILDTGVSVRKRVIKILRDICLEYPEYPKIPEICMKMIRRVNDEDGIRKLVIEVFQNMWFTPIKDKPLQSKVLQQKVLNITDVVSVCKDTCLEWFEQLLVTLFKPKEDKDDSTKIVTEPPKVLIMACKQIVDCLVDNIMSLDGRGGNAPQRLVACVTTLYIFAKIRPQLLVDHAITLQPYLALKCQTPGDYQIISFVARTLEIVVPMLEHASEMFLSQLEEDSVKLIFQHDQTVILSCLSCLGSVVNNVTHNYALIRDCFLRYYQPLQSLKGRLQEGNNIEVIKKNLNYLEFRRSMYIVGLMLRFFDFKSESMQGDKLSRNICNDVFDTLAYFMFDDDKESSLFALKSIGNICIRHYEYMMQPELKNHYLYLLQSEDAPITMKVQVLNNIKLYLQEEEKRMIKQDEEWSRLSKKENLKEMGDVSSGMASTIIQHYLKDILESFLHPSSCVRQATLRVVQLVLTQGLVHPVQIVPYLICMSTDDEKGISIPADKQLQEIEKKYPGFIHMRAQYGIKLSFRFQQIIQNKSEVIRGFKIKDTELPAALNGFLYSILRTKQQRRALVLSILKQFEESAKTCLSQMLYLADNIAYFPYQVLDEPLFIIHQINLMISVTGTNLLQSFKEGLLPDPDATEAMKQNPESALDEDDDEDEECLLTRLPDDTTSLQQCMTASEGCLMLLVLKQHLKTLYGFTDSKIAIYSPSESAKIYDKSVSRKNNSKFHPKAALQKLINGNPSTILDDTAKRELIGEYLEFKHLIISLDREEEDETESTKPVHTPSSRHSIKATPTSNNTPSRVNYSHGYTPSHSASYRPDISMQDSPHLHNTYTSCQTQSTPTKIKLTIVKPVGGESSKHSSHSHHRSHKNKKSDRHKKHHHKRKKKSYQSDGDSDNVNSDPDFLI